MLDIIEMDGYCLVTKEEEGTKVETSFDISLFSDTFSESRLSPKHRHMLLRTSHPFLNKFLSPARVC